MPEMKPIRLGLIGYDDVQGLDLIGPSDAFTMASLEDEQKQAKPCYEVFILGLSRRPFRTESGILMQPHVSLREAPALDTLIIPGGKGARLGRAGEAIREWILTRAGRIRRIASVCTGIYALAPTGLLDGRRVTTHWRFADDVARRFPKLKVDHDALFLKDGPFYTAGGITACVDLALALIDEDFGPRIALSVARELVVYLKRAGDRSNIPNLWSSRSIRAIALPIWHRGCRSICGPIFPSRHWPNGWVFLRDIFIGGSKTILERLRRISWKTCDSTRHGGGWSSEPRQSRAWRRPLGFIATAHFAGRSLSASELRRALTGIVSTSGHSRLLAEQHLQQEAGVAGLTKMEKTNEQNT